MPFTVPKASCHSMAAGKPSKLSSQVRVESVEFSAPVRSRSETSRAFATQGWKLRRQWVKHPQTINKDQDTAGVKEITSSEQEKVEWAQVVSKGRGLSEVEPSNSRTQVARRQVSIEKLQVEGKKEASIEKVKWAHVTSKDKGLSWVESSDTCTEIALKKIPIKKMQVKKNREHAIHKMAENLRVKG